MSDTILHQIVSMSPRLAPLTRRGYLDAIDRWVAFAGTDPRGWTRMRAQEFYNTLLSSGMKPQTANFKMFGLRYASKRLALNENRPELDFARIDLAKKEPRKTRTVLSPDQSIALLDTTEGNNPIDLRDRALIVVALETGMRRMSLGSMTLEGIKHKRYPIASVLLKGHGQYPYDVPLSDTAILGMQPWRTWLTNQKIRNGPMFRRLIPQIDKRGSRVYTAGDVGLSESMIWKIIDGRSGKAGIGHVHPHIFRHTYITSREDKLTMFEIASVTGHKLPQSGELGGYMNLEELGGKARRYTPDWLSEWCEKMCR